MQVYPNFEQQARKNLEFQENYGSYKSVYAPHWTGTEGDKAALMRSAFPDIQAKQYFNSPTKFIFQRNLVTTALQGTATKITDARVLTAKDDYTPNINRTSVAQLTGYNNVGMKSGLISGNEIAIGTILTIGALGFIMLY